MDEKNMQILKGKVAVISGGSGDLGLAMAGALGEAGASIALASRDRAKLDAAADRLQIERSRILIYSFDVSDKDQVASLMKQVADKFGRIDILVTAAGIQCRKPALEFSREDWDSVLNTNLSGTFFCCQEAAKYMIPQRKGKIIMVSSLTAEIGLPDMSAYVASRGAIKQLSKALAVEWAKHGINVNCIGPGRFRTTMTEDVFADDEIRNSFMKLIPMGRAGEPSDLAGLTVFLASDLSDYITGQSIYVDGGWLASGGSSKR